MTLLAIQLGEPARRAPRRKSDSLANAARTGQLCLCPSCIAAFPERAELRRKEIREVGRRFGALTKAREA